MLKTANLSMVFITTLRPKHELICSPDKRKKHICKLRMVLYGLPKFGELWHTKGWDSVAYFHPPCRCTDEAWVQMSSEWNVVQKSWERF